MRGKRKREERGLLSPTHLGRMRLEEVAWLGPVRGRWWRAWRRRRWKSKEAAGGGAAVVGAPGCSLALFIGEVGRWRGGGRWPAPRVLRRPLMAPGRPLRVTVRRGRRGRGTGRARCAVVVARRVWWRPTRWRDAGGGVRRARLSGRRGDAARRRDASSAQRAAAGQARGTWGRR